jgi:hypothetical protein
MCSELGSASPHVDNWAVRSTLLSASLRLFLLVAVCLSASITEAQKTVRLIEIHSGWGGLGTSQNADVIIRSKDGVFVRDGKPVDAAQVEPLVTALKAPGVAKPDMENLGITSAWLKAHVASQHPRGRAQGTETTASQRELFATSFTNPDLIAKVIPYLFRFTRADDYSGAKVEVLFEDGGDLLGGLISVDEQFSFFICRPGQASSLCSPRIAPNYIARFTQSSNLDQRRSLQLARVVVRANYQKCSRQTWPADI